MQKGTSARKQPEKRRPRVRISDGKLIGLYGQLGRMMEAGIPVTEALSLAAHHSRGPLAEALEQARGAVERGETLAEASGFLFPSSATVLLKAAETTGALPAAFHSLATAVELRVDVRRQIVRALILPLVLFTLVFFVPKAYLLFSAGWAAYLQACLVPYVLSLAGLTAAVWGVPRGLRLILGPARSARLVRALPIIGGLLALSARIRFCRNLASAMEAGLGARESLDLAAQTTGHPMWQERLERAARYIEDGSDLHQALERVGLLDGDLLLALASGERAGRMPESLEQQARLAQSTLSHRLNVALQVLSVSILLGTYFFVATRVVSEYQTVLGGTGKQIEKLMKEIGVDGKSGSDVQRMMNQLKKEGGGLELEDLLRRAKDPVNLDQLPPDIRKHLQ